MHSAQQLTKNNQIQFVTEVEKGFETSVCSFECCIAGIAAGRIYVTSFAKFPA